METIRDYYQTGRTKEDMMVNSSSLKYINPEEGGSPAAFLDFITNNEQEEEKKHFRLGSMVHLWHEDRENFVVSSIPKPPEKLGQVADKIIDLVKQGNPYDDQTVYSAIETLGYQRNWKYETRLSKVYEGCDSYIQEVLTTKENNQIFLTESEAEVIKNACEAIEKHPVANELLFPIMGFSEAEQHKELEIYFEQIIGLNNVPVLCKGKLDNITIDFEKKIITLVDLKTTSSSAYHFINSFTNYRYYRQLGFYKLAIMAYLSQKGYNAEDFKFIFRIVVAETTKLQQCVVYKIDPKYILQGSTESINLLSRIAYHQINDNWSYSFEEMNNGHMITLKYPDEA